MRDLLYEAIHHFFDEVTMDELKELVRKSPHSIRGVRLLLLKFQ